MKTPAFIDDYASEDRAYITSHKHASDGVKDGKFIAYCTGHDHDIGRYIDVETTQGWSTIYSDSMALDCAYN